MNDLLVCRPISSVGVGRGGGAGAGVVAAVVLAVLLVALLRTNRA